MKVIFAPVALCLEPEEVARAAVEWGCSHEEAYARIIKDMEIPECSGIGLLGAPMHSGTDTVH
jgi:hypothetical protein